LQKFSDIKSVLSIILLTLFSLRPVYQLGCYGYYQLNIDTIIVKYCENNDRPEVNCDGKCYLAKTLQLQHAQSKSDSKEQALSLLVEAFFPLYFQEVASYQLKKVNLIRTSHKTGYFFSLKNNVQDIIKPPPRVVLNT